MEKRNDATIKYIVTKMRRKRRWGVTRPTIEQQSRIISLYLAYVIEEVIKGVIWYFPNRSGAIYVVEKQVTEDTRKPYNQYLLHRKGIKKEVVNHARMGLYYEIVWASKALLNTTMKFKAGSLFRKKLNSILKTGNHKYTSN